MMKWKKWGKRKKRRQKNSRREFRPRQVFYLPIYIYWFILGIKSKSLVFFSASNPWFFMGWFGDYSKRAILKQFDTELIPQTLFVSHGTPNDLVRDQLSQQWLTFPLIIKPDSGERWFMVAKITNWEEFNEQLHIQIDDFLIQEYIDYPFEYGVLYYRFPWEKYGHISGIVGKEFLTVTGNGKDTLEELITAHPRLRFYDTLLAKQYHDERDSIITQWTTKKLIEFGTHSRGSMFVDASDLITDAMVQKFDNISSQVEWFHIGRYDVKVESIEDLQAWRVKILELNGAEWEPTWMYDPKNSVWKARRIMFHHWSILAQISRLNHKQWAPYLWLREGIRSARNHLGKRKKVK